MHDRRLRRRITGALRKRLDEVRLDLVRDDRDPRGQKWKLVTVLRAVVLGLVAGTNGLGSLERLTSEMSKAIRRRFKLARRLPDTSARNVLCGLEPVLLIPRLHNLIRVAVRRKAIRHDGLPFGVASIDAKCVSIPAADDWLAQRQNEGGERLRGVVRTINAVLTSCLARPVIHTGFVPAPTNEMGWFRSEFSRLVEAYRGLDLFRLVTYDAGATSLENASFVRQYGVHYLFALKATQPTLHAEAVRLLGARGDEECDAMTVDADRTTRRVFVATVAPGYNGWQHLVTILRIVSSRRSNHGKVVTETRYFISSMPAARLKPEQWMLIVRRHWGVETMHQVLDVSFEEDKHPWIKADPRGAAVVMVLRRLAYTLLTLFRGVTQRSQDNRSKPWAVLMHEVWLTLASATDDDLRGMKGSVPALA